MRKTGKYCKAYQVKRFREFDGWTENTERLRERKEIIEGIEGKEAAVVRSLSDDDILYIQEDFTVTDGIFLNEHVIYDNVTPEWQEFCRATLKFELPVYEIRKKLDSANADGAK
jgi:hypothetical protein